MERGPLARQRRTRVALARIVRRVRINELRDVRVEELGQFMGRLEGKLARAFEKWIG